MGTPSAFIFLYENQLFLTFRRKEVTVWNLRGEKVSSFQDHTLWHPDCNTNNIYITNSQDVILSYCSASKAPDKGSVNISSIFTGESLASIAPCTQDGTKRRHNAALQGISAVFYSEEHHEIYTGNEQGLLHTWASRPQA